MPELDAPGRLAVSRIGRGRTINFGDVLVEHVAIVTLPSSSGRNGRPIRAEFPVKLFASNEHARRLPQPR
jgi:hypothetical protein